ncbi:hypothetical protein [Actinospongicola halichondriae]|uniref:hypothetical protein n=1 Tax=Actinospongicola halichondriae TaxID=3236844 RepID=UPI003D3DE574
MTTTQTTTAAETLPTTSTVSADDANRAFSTSILISAVRCTLAYVVFPWMLPLFGLAGGVGPGIGLAVGVIAIGFNIASIRRFHRSDHRWKWPITALNCTVIVLLTVLAVIDLTDILS